MIPVTQTRTGAPKGNCTEACIASLLECSLEEVPSLWHEDDGEEGPRDPTGQRNFQLYAFIVSRGFFFACYRFEHDYPLTELAQQFKRLPVPAVTHMEQGYIIGGHTPDGVPHAVVGGVGGVVHDPNPSRRGIVTFDEVTVLVPLDVVWEVPKHRYRVGAWYRPSTKDDAPYDAWELIMEGDE